MTARPDPPPASKAKTESLLPAERFGHPRAPDSGGGEQATYLQRLLLASFPILVIFWLMPLQVYLQNAAALNFDIGITDLWALSGVALIIAVAIWMRKSSGALWPGVLFAIGLAVIAADISAPVQLPPLDGVLVTAKEPLLTSVMEVVVAGAVLLGISRALKTSAFHRIGASVAGAVLGLTLVAYGYLYVEAPSSAAAMPVAHGKDLPTVYHFHMDELQSDFAREVLGQQTFAKDFAGFTLFARNTANYPYTAASLASYHTGTIFRSGNYADWVRDFDKGLIKHLGDAGYEVEVVGLPENVGTPLAHRFTAPSRIFQEVSSIQHPELPEFTALWLARCAPNFLTNEALLVGKRIGQAASRWMTDAHAQGDAPANVEEGIAPFQAKLGLEYLTRSEMRKAARSRYLFVQAIMPHSPYIFDADCRRHPPRVSGEAYAGQAGCAIRLVANFIAELKRLGRYDDALIIVHGDHGGGWTGFAPAPPEDAAPDANRIVYGHGVTAFGGFTDALESRSMAALMIKLPGAKHELRISDGRSQLLDVYPTVLEVLGIKTKEAVEGTSLVPCLRTQDCDAISRRPQLFYVFPNTSQGTPLTENVVEFSGGRAHFSDVRSVDDAGK